MEYIRIEKGIIAEHVAGEKPDGEWVEVKEFWGAVGEPVEWYDKEWNRIDDITLYETGFRQIPDGMKLNDAHTDLMETSEEEKIIAGIKPIPLGQKIVDGKLEEKTQREMWQDGDISTEEFAERKRRERDAKLSSTDKYMVIDFPISEEKRQQIKEYRQLLRDLTQNELWPDVEIPEYLGGKI